MNLSDDEYEAHAEMLQGLTGLLPPRQFTLASFALIGADEIKFQHCTYTFEQEKSLWRHLAILDSGLIASISMAAQVSMWNWRSAFDNFNAPSMTMDARLRRSSDIHSLQLLNISPSPAGSSLILQPTWSVTWNDQSTWDLAPSAQASRQSVLLSNLLVMRLREMLSES